MSYDKMKPLLRKICFRKAEERNGVINEEARQPFFQNTKKAPSTPSNKVLNWRSYQVLKGTEEQKRGPSFCSAL